MEKNRRKANKIKCRNRMASVAPIELLWEGIKCIYPIFEGITRKSKWKPATKCKKPRDHKKCLEIRNCGSEIDETLKYGYFLFFLFVSTKF